MIIGVTGDTHNNLKNINEICSIFNKNRTDLVFHTGDISLPKSLLCFKELKCPLIVVLGNNDLGEKNGLLEVSKSFDCEIVEEPYSFLAEDKKIALMHHPDLINEKIIESHDYVFHGHTHRFRLEKIQDCIIFNPGECAGFIQGKNQIGIVNLLEIDPKVINF